MKLVTQLLQTLVNTIQEALRIAPAPQPVRVVVRRPEQSQRRRRY